MHPLRWEPLASQSHISAVVKACSTSVLCLDMICLMGTSSSAIALLQGTIRAHRLADVVLLGLI